MALAAPTPEQKYTLEAIKWPSGYPFANVWIVRKNAKGEYLPIRELKNITDPSSNIAQNALSEEKQKLFNIHQREELSETCSS